MSSGIGILGGTFNPVHNGHLRTAVELRERLQLAAVRLMPAAAPPHRGRVDCPAEMRAEMVGLACEAVPGIDCDRRELERPGPSYTIDSLAEIRAEEGADRSLCLVLGIDAAAHLDSWRRWRELPDYAHLVLVARPGWDLPRSGPAADWVAARLVPDAAALGEKPAGAVFIAALTPYAISSTAVRERIAAGKPPGDALPDPVWHYIQERGLYGCGASGD